MKIHFNDVGIILIPGINNDEINNLSQKLILSGYIVKMPLLNDKSIKERIEKLEEIYLQLRNSCKEIILIGNKVGGLLSLYLASKYKVKGIITINTPIYIRDVLKLYLFKNPFKHLSILKQIKKLIPSVKCDVLINQAKYLKRSTNYLFNSIPSKIKKKILFRKKQSEDVMLDLVKYIECFSM